MDLWDKMKSGMVDAFGGGKLENEEFFTKIKEALEEFQKFEGYASEFIDPNEVEEYRGKYQEAYNTAKSRTEKLFFAIGLSGRRNRNLILKFINQYEALPVIVQRHNNQVAEERIPITSKLILPVEGQQLDEQQMHCIVKEERNHLVLAGAGTGKTTTILGYVKYLLKTERATPDKLLLLSFTNASAAEMSQRLQRELGTVIDAQTFHKLGLDIITAVKGVKPKIYSQNIKKFVSDQLEALIQDKEYLKKLCIFLTYGIVNQKSEFEFTSLHEYEAFLQFNKPVTLQGERVKSFGELYIANFLFLNNVEYVYEKEYPIDTRTMEYGQYYPDFYLPEYDIYVEYFGINRAGEVPSYFTGRDGKTATQSYQASMQWKRELHKKQGTCLVETYAYEHLEERLLLQLEKRLKEVGVILKPMSSDEIWGKIEGTKKQKIDRVADLFGMVITLIKSNGNRFVKGRLPWSYTFFFFELLSCRLSPRL